jgi:hypothetical protein
MTDPGYRNRPNLSIRLAVFVAVLSLLAACSSVPTEPEAADALRFEEVSERAFGSWDAPSLSECHRNLRTQDSIARPDARRLDVVEPLTLTDGRIEGDLDNLPIHMSSLALYKCEHLIGSPSLLVADLDGDGYDDIVKSPNVVYMNNGDGTFTVNELSLATPQRTEVDGVVPTPNSERLPSKPVVLDVDNDGVLEIMVSYQAGTNDQLFTVFRQQAGDLGNISWTVDTDLSFSNTQQVISSVQTLTVVDYDLDGYSDVIAGIFTAHVVNYSNRLDGFDSPGLILLRNNAGRGFVDVSEETGINQAVADAVDLNEYQGTSSRMDDEITWVHAVSTADLDNDGYPDLLVAGDFGTGMLLWNDRGRGYGLEPGIDFLGHSLMGPALADINGDGYLDLFVSQVHTKLSRRWTCAGGRPCNNETLGNFWWVSDGPRRYVDRAAQAGLLDGGWGWGSVFVDLDNDGVEELAQAAGLPALISPGMPGFDHRRDPLRLWTTSGRLNPDVWTDVARSAGVVEPIATLSVATGDFDRDGRADLVVGTLELGRPLLYLNRGATKGNWLEIVPVREVDGRRVEVFGARIEVTYALVDGRTRTALRYSGTQSQSYYSNSGPASWFGVGSSDRVQITIRWPDGNERTWRDHPVNQRLELAP